VQHLDHAIQVERIGPIHGHEHDIDTANFIV
jgi:hypothetical protein